MIPIETVTGLIDRQAREAGEDPAFYYLGEATSYGALDDISRRAAQGLRALGVKPGDRVALWLPNTPAYLILYLACARLGAIAVAVNTRFRAVEVADIISRSGATVMALWPGFRGIDFLGILDEIDAAKLSKLEKLILYDEDGESLALPPSAAAISTLSYGELLAHPPYGGDDAKPDAGVNIFTTSGTTKAPKFVLHSHRGVAIHSQQVADNFAGMMGDGALLQAIPFCGVFGFTQAMMGLAGGRPIAITSAFEAREAVELIDRYNVRYLNATDDMIAAMLDIDPRDQALPSVQGCGYAAFSANSEEIAARAETRGLKLLGLYGMSEVQALFSRRDPAAPMETRLLPGGEIVSPQAHVRARDVDSGEILPHGQEGELEISGPSLMLEYFENPEATREALTEDGYIRSGDLGYTQDDRSFVYLARMGDVLRLGGFLVSPAEIEAHILTFPGVEGCQVVGGALGDTPKAFAFITAAGEDKIDETALARHCVAGLARFKVPARIFQLADFPTTKSANGTKIQKAVLRQWAMEWTKEMPA